MLNEEIKNNDFMDNGGELVTEIEESCNVIKSSGKSKAIGIILTASALIGIGAYVLIKKIKKSNDRSDEYDNDEFDDVEKETIEVEGKVIESEDNEKTTKNK